MWKPSGRFGLLIDSGVFLCFLFSNQPNATADEYSFDMSSYEKRSFEVNGYGEFRWEQLHLEPDAALYKINFISRTPRHLLNRTNVAAQLEGRYRKDDFTFYARVLPSAYTDALNSDSQFAVHEFNLMWQVNSGLTLDAGKKLMKWGKGYAWNPVGFVERPKDPNEPDLGREGYTILAGDLVSAHQGALQTIAFTPVLLPVYNNVNEDYGEHNHLNLAGKLYFLYRNTDIDLLFLSSGSRSARVGVDFSRNVSANFEVHGEWAFINDNEWSYIDSSGLVQTHAQDTRSWLLGLRYLTESETTYLFEYYHNDAGLSEDETHWFYQAVDTAVATGSGSMLIPLRGAAKDLFSGQTIMRNYVYMRVAQKDPFDILYATPALTLIYNVDDHSYNLSPEIAYTGITNLELRAKLIMLHGDVFSEFAEKQNSSKLELRMRYYF